jgi:Rod binding domain-containing protein
MTMNVIKPASIDLSIPANAKAWKAAQDFEAMALGQLLAPMFDTVKSGNGLFGGGSAEETWRPMMTQELAKGMAKAGGLGLAAPIYRQILAMQENLKGSEK